MASTPPPVAAPPPPPGEEMRILSPTAILGYGFPEASFRAGLDSNPHVIAVDAGSTDPGPYYLGAGKSFSDREAVKRDLRLILTAAREHNIPVIIGSAGGAGARPHLIWNQEIILEIAREESLNFRLATIGADITKLNLLTALSAGQLTPLPPAPPATVDDIVESSYVVAQMGVEPFIGALDQGADVILAGRAYDPAVFAALPIRAGYDPGLALHLGKILECAAIAALPGSGSDCMLGVLRADHFIVEPLNPVRTCTITSVSAHTLYEKTNPYFLPGPGGTLDLTNTTFAQETDRTVRVAGTRFVTTPFAVKLEAARRVGYRTVSIAGVRDPVFIEKVDEIVEAVRARVADNFSHVPADRYRLLVHLYGKNGVMGPLEPTIGAVGHELGVLIEAVAETQELANTICGFARSTMLHFGYKGRISTAGNLAFPYSPSDFTGGEVYRFSLYHLLETADPTELFPVVISQVAEDSTWQ
jgi:Acyclic terpene utilisation family protein AtuA